MFPVALPGIKRKSLQSKAHGRISNKLA